MSPPSISAEPVAAGGAWGRRGHRRSPRQRAIAITLALVFELLLVLALLTLGARKAAEMADESALSTFDVRAVPAPQPTAEPSREAPRQREQTEPEEQVTPQPAVRITPPVPQPAPKLPSPLVELPADTMAAADLRSRPQAPPKSGPPAGPPAPAGFGDTPLVDGSGPNGERLYAAAWYRRPYDSELRGYLSTVRGPGWALIACRTVADFRVDDCIALDEFPAGSQMARAVLAAAWQFRVRPPQIGGRLQVGEWVRIRIDYTERRGS